MNDAHAPAPAGASEKRSGLHGGALTDEALASSDAVLQTSGYRGPHKGLQQFFSPPEAATLAATVMGGQSANAPYVLDPTAGSGALIAGWPRERRFGIEIDADHVEAGPYRAIHGDLQRLYPLLRLAGVRFPALVCNPPFGLTWKDPRTGRPTNSTGLCLRFALGLLDEHGQGLLIAGRDRYHREIASLPGAQGVWCTIDCDDLFDRTALPVTLAFFVAPANRREAATRRLTAERARLAELAPEVIQWRGRACGYVTRSSYDDGSAMREAFACVQREHDRRRGQRRSRNQWDLALVGGRLRCRPSAFAKLALARRGTLRQFQGLDGAAIHYFALNLREWRQLQDASHDEVLTIEPRLPERVEAIVRDARRDATPLYAVKPQMRLGFLEDLERIVCNRTDPKQGFVAGERYRIDCESKVQTEQDIKLVHNRDGEPEPRDIERERKLLTIRIAKDPAAEHSYGGHEFDETKTSIDYLVEHFEIPDPGDIGTRFPRELARATHVLSDIERECMAPRGQRFKAFQVEDLARLLVKGKGPLAWDTGCGKTLGQLAWAEACRRYWRCQNAALFVMPQDLLEQFRGEAEKFFGRDVQLIQTPGDAKRVDRHVGRGGEGWYATHYEALSRVGRKDEPLPAVALLTPGERRFGPRRRDADGNILPPRTVSSSEFCPGCRADLHAGWEIGTCRGCGYVHKRLKVRTVASLLATTFRRAVVCVDELTEMQGDDSLRGKAVRGLRCRHPLGGTGTPISNYVNSAFYGLWWCCGNATSRFPYDIDGKAQFERDFCVIEHTLGKAGTEQEGRRQRRKILPEVTNVSVLWRLLATNMVRRRKEDTGEPIVARSFRPIEVPMGTRQLELQRKVLSDFVRWFEHTHPNSPLVTAGVVQQFAAGCGMLPKLDYAATLPEADPDHAWWGVPATNWTPANLKVLELALHHARQGDRILIGSSLIETGRWIAERLTERGVQALHIVEERDGRAQTKNPRKRSAEIKAFKDGAAQVLCCGVQAVKLGHNLDQVNTVIVHGLPWTHLALKQFVDRAWRLTSPKDVTVWVVIPRIAGSQTIAERKWQLVLDKGAASDLALDGQLIEKPERPIDWNRVLRQMRTAGVQAVGDELPESDIERLWLAADGPYAPLRPPATATPLAQRPATERRVPTTQPSGEEHSGQLVFNLAA